MEKSISDEAIITCETTLDINGSLCKSSTTTERSSTVNRDNSPDFVHIINEILGLKQVGVSTYSPLGLAYIGDSVYDLIIRSMVISKGNRQVQKLHQESSTFVQASTQSLMMRAIQEHLTETEHAIYRRGRNSKTITPAKNQSITDYRRATGFEALIGYLYLNEEYKRLMELIKIGLESIPEET